MAQCKQLADVLSSSARSLAKRARRAARLSTLVLIVVLESLQPEDVQARAQRLSKTDHLSIGESQNIAGVAGEIC